MCDPDITEICLEDFGSGGILTGSANAGNFSGANAGYTYELTWDGSQWKFHVELGLAYWDFLGGLDQCDPTGLYTDDFGNTATLFICQTTTTTTGFPNTSTPPNTPPPTTSYTTTPSLSDCCAPPPNPPILNDPVVPNFTTLTIPPLVINLAPPTSSNPFTNQITTTVTTTTIPIDITTTIIPRTGTIVPECEEYCKKLGY